MHQIYGELHRIASAKMQSERSGHTLQATALLHEAWMRLHQQDHQRFQSRGHFFGAAAESMRRILIESARRRLRQKRTLPEEPPESQLEEAETPSDEMLAVNEAVEALEKNDADAANLVKLRYFAGMTMKEAAVAMDMPLRSVERLWAYARAWLRRHLENH